MLPIVVSIVFGVVPYLYSFSLSFLFFFVEIVLYFVHHLLLSAMVMSVVALLYFLVNRGLSTVFQKGDRWMVEKLPVVRKVGLRLMVV